MVAHWVHPPKVLGSIPFFGCLSLLMCFIKLLILKFKLNIFLNIPSFSFTFFYYLILYFIYIDFFLLSFIIPLIISIAYITLIERKVIGSTQLRIGPNFIGFFGLLQPIADGLKLFFKETILPTKADKLLFLFAPFFCFFLSLLIWSIIPMNFGIIFADLNLGILFFFAISSLNVYAIIMAGWSSNSNYALLGALRSAAQMISYEVSIGIILISVLLCVGSLNLTLIVKAQESIWFIIPQFPAFLMFYISALAETNRPPFDLPEAEAELVSGYNVEYSAISFALFFLAEYANIILISFLITIIFLGGWLPIPFLETIYISKTMHFILKILIVISSFIWVRTTLPRFRFDQLMILGWKYLLPLSIGWLILTASILINFDFLPN